VFSFRLDWSERKKKGREQPAFACSSHLECLARPLSALQRLKSVEIFVMDVADGRDEQAPAPLPHNSSSSPTPSPPPKLPSSSPDPMATSSQQQQQQQQQAPAPPEAPAAAAAAPAATAASVSFARPSSPLSPNKKTSFDLGGSSSGAGAGPASLSPHPSLGRLSLGRISSRRLTAGGGGGVATPEETTMTMRMGRLLSVRKEEWSGDASLRRRNEEEEGKVTERIFLFNLSAPLLSSLPSKKKLNCFPKKLNSFHDDNDNEKPLSCPSPSRYGARWPSPMVRRKAFSSERGGERGSEERGSEERGSEKEMKNSPPSSFCFLSSSFNC